MGYLIALIPPFLDSVAIYVDKFLLSKHEINSTIITLYSGFFAFVAGLLIWFFLGFYFIDAKSAIIIAAAGFLGIFYLFAYFKALTYDEGSRVGSLFQLVPVIVLFLSFVFLGEKLHPKQYIGAILVVIAGFSLSLQRDDLGKFKLNKAFWFMLLSSFLSAMVYVSFKLGVMDVGFWQALPYEGLGSGLAMFSILFYGKNFRLLIKSKKLFKTKALTYMTIVELLSRVSRYILFLALSLIPASIASVLMGVQPLFLLILGLCLSLFFPHLIKEVIDKKTVVFKLLAFFIILVGLSLIFL